MSSAGWVRAELGRGASTAAVVAALAVCLACSDARQVSDQGSDNPLPQGWESLAVRVKPMDGRATRSSGEPLILQVVLDNIEAVREVNRQNPTAEEARAGLSGIPTVAVEDDTTPWQERVRFSVVQTAGDQEVLEDLDWAARRLGEREPAASRTVGFRPLRAAWALDRSDIVALAPGTYRIVARLPPVGGGGEARVSEPLELELTASSETPSGQAAEALAQARFLVRRGDFAEAIRAAQRSLELDPGLHDAMGVVAQSHAQLGDRDEAIQWYERYLATFSDEDARDGYPSILREIIESLRAQQ